MVHLIRIERSSWVEFELEKSSTRTRIKFRAELIFISKSDQNSAQSSKKERREDKENDKKRREDNEN
jgi:hypothetical protein